MGVNKYPLCEKIGLYIHEDNVIRALQVEHMLSEAPLINCVKFSNGLAFIAPTLVGTHMARLIGIEPIKKDDATSILKEVLEWAEVIGDNQQIVFGQDMVHRIRKVLGGS